MGSPSSPRPTRSSLGSKIKESYFLYLPGGSFSFHIQLMELKYVHLCMPPCTCILKSPYLASQGHSWNLNPGFLLLEAKAPCLPSNGGAFPGVSRTSLMVPLPVQAAAPGRLPTPPIILSSSQADYEGNWDPSCLPSRHFEPGVPQGSQPPGSWANLRGSVSVNTTASQAHVVTRGLLAEKG